LAALLIWLTKKGQVMSYWYHLRTTVENGELTIFAVSLLGPILFLALDDVPENADSPGRTKEFPGKISHMFVVVVLCLLCGALYAGIKVGTDFEQSALFVTSFYIAVAAVTLRYLATAYRKETLRPDEDWKADEEDFVEQFKKR